MTQGEGAARRRWPRSTCGGQANCCRPRCVPLAGSPGLATHGGAPLRGVARGVRLPAGVIAATGDPDVNRAVYEDGEAARVWVNSADDPDNCSFILPAVAAPEGWLHGRDGVLWDQRLQPRRWASWLEATRRRTDGPRAGVGTGPMLLAGSAAEVEGSGKEHRRGRLAAGLGLGHVSSTLHPLWDAEPKQRSASEACSIAVVGINHRTVAAPRIGAHGSWQPRRPSFLQGPRRPLVVAPTWTKVVVLSTCMRTECSSALALQLFPRRHGRHPRVLLDLERQTSGGLL